MIIRTIIMYKKTQQVHYNFTHKSRTKTVIVFHRRASINVNPKWVYTQYK